MSRQAAFAFAITACFLVTGILLASEKAEHPHWGYEGEGGPGHWGHLEPSFEKCESGRAQSPVDLAGAAEKDMAGSTFHTKTSR